jgi:hypothetical protein
MCQIPGEACESGLELFSDALVRALQEAAEHELVTFQRLLDSIEHIQQLVLVEDAAEHEAESVLHDELVLEDHGLALTEHLRDQG